MRDPKDLSPIEYWRERIFRNVSLLALTVGMLAYVPTMVFSALHGIWGVAIVDTLVYAYVALLLVVPGLSLRFRVISFAVAVYALAALLLLQLGPISTPFLLMCSVFIALLAGMRWVVASVFVNFLLVLVLGFQWTDRVHLGDVPLQGNHFGWTVVSLNFAFINMVTVVAVAMLMRGLQRSLEKERAISAALEREQQHILDTHEKLKREVIERYRVEKERQRLAMAVDQAAEVVVITDTSGRVQYVNAAFERLSGYARAEILGENLRVAGGDASRADLWAAVDAGEVWFGELVQQDKRGREYRIEATVSPLRDDRGETISYVAVGRDITNEVQLQEQLRRSQKLEAIGTLAGGIAHDFNNILMSIFGFTELTKAGLPGGSPLQPYLDEILRGSQRARDLVQQILTFSRQMEVPRQPVAMGLIVNEAMRLLRASIPATIRIDVDVPSGVGTVFADPSQIHQVIMNLCTNAYHAMEQQGGTLGIRLKRVEADAALAASLPRLRAGQAYACLTVTDTGVGMGPETLERVFDPFFSTKEPGKGTGLGLATVHGIVSALHGDIRVDSEPGVGTEFQVYLPCVESPVPDSPAAPAGEDPRGQGEHILVVDDERVLLELGEDMLRALGYDTTVCESPAHALELLRANPDRYHALLTDQTMPGMTGAELIRRMRDFAPTLPVVMVSGYSETLTPERLEEFGVNGFLQKPYTRLSLARILHAALHPAGAAAAK